MQNIIKTIFFSLGIISIAISCNDDQDQSTPPEVCFDLIISSSNRNVCEIKSVWLDASCTSDDFTETKDILVRWDFDSDGDFDTDFDTTKVILLTPNYNQLDNTTVTVEAQDEDGNISSFANKLDLIDLPRPSDLIAKGVEFFANYDDWIAGENSVNTIASNQEFFITGSSICFGDFSSPSFTNTISLDQQVVEESESSCNGGPTGCLGRGLSYTIDTPGEYEFTYTIDALNDHIEVDENNNQVSATIVITQ